MVTSSLSPHEDSSSRRRIVRNKEEQLFEAYVDDILIGDFDSMWEAEEACDDAIHRWSIGLPIDRVV